jgi:hypothetical protein
LEAVVARHAFVLLAIIIATAGCNPGTAPVIHDVDVARARWLAEPPSSYVFEESVATSWVSKFPYFKVTVVSNSITTIVNEKGAAVPAPWVISIDSLWNRIISERARGSLNSAVFSEAGVPLEADWGPWPVDGGVHYYIRNFGRR